MNEAARQYLSEIGKRGGSSKSDRKRQASRANIAKARAAKARKDWECE